MQNPSGGVLQWLLLTICCKVYIASFWYEEIPTYDYHLNVSTSKLHSLLVTFASTNFFVSVKSKLIYETFTRQVILFRHLCPYYCCTGPQDPIAGNCADLYRHDVHRKATYLLDAGAGYSHTTCGFTGGQLFLGSRFDTTQQVLYECCAEAWDVSKRLVGWLVLFNDIWSQ